MQKEAQASTIWEQEKATVYGCIHAIEKAEKRFLMRSNPPQEISPCYSKCDKAKLSWDKAQYGIEEMCADSQSKIRIGTSSSNYSVGPRIYCADRGKWYSECENSFAEGKLVDAAS